MNYTEQTKAAALDGQSAYIWRFDDPAEAATTIRAGCPGSINGSSWEERSGWFGSESPADAAQYAITGNDRLVADAERYLDKIEHAGIETVRHEWEPSLCGAYPVVGDFLAGRPDCMRRRFERAGERAPVRVICDGTSSTGIKASDLQRRGAAILAFIMALAQERPVELWAAVTLDGHAYRRNMSAILVRCPTSPLNLGVCAHLLTSQAWTRGIGYGWLAAKAGAKGGWAWGEPGGKDYERLTRAAFDMTEQDVLVPAIALGDELTSRPVDWINRTLARIRETTAAEA